MDISVKAYEAVPGRVPGSDCPACKIGTLMPKIETESGDNGTMGPDGRSWCYSYICKLACNNCSACFEIAKEYRGLELHRHLKEQLMGFENPVSKPKTCLHCERTLIECSHFATDEQRYFSTANAETKFLYCDVCFTVKWVEEHKAESQNP